MPEIAREPSAAECLDRSRSAVLNILVGVGAMIAASGWVLGHHAPEAGLPWSPAAARRAAFVALALVVTVAYTILRVVAGREALRDPGRRAARFYRGRVIAAGVAGLAVPLGFAYGWWVDPRLEAIAPFWVAALGLGFLALPRGHELDDFEEPMARA